MFSKTQRFENKPDLKPELLSELTFDEIYDKLGLEEPKPEEVTDLKAYMRVQSKVMQALIDQFHSEELAIKLFHEKLSQEFADRYRHGF